MGSDEDDGDLTDAVVAAGDEVDDEVCRGVPVIHAINNNREWDFARKGGEDIVMQGL